MAAWTSDELRQIAEADELQLASARADGTLRNPVTIWVVRHDDDLYVRPVGGHGSTWFRGTQDRHEGHIRAGGVDQDVVFVQAGSDANDAIDDAYRTKYHRYPETYVADVVTSQARAATIKLVPRSSGS